MGDCSEYFWVSSTYRSFRLDIFLLHLAQINLTTSLLPQQSQQLVTGYQKRALDDAKVAAIDNKRAMVLWLGPDIMPTHEAIMNVKGILIITRTRSVRSP